MVYLPGEFVEELIKYALPKRSELWFCTRGTHIFSRMIGLKDEPCPICAEIQQERERGKKAKAYLDILIRMRPGAYEHESYFTKRMQKLAETALKELEAD